MVIKKCGRSKNVSKKGNVFFVDFSVDKDANRGKIDEECNILIHPNTMKLMDEYDMLKVIIRDMAKCGFITDDDIRGIFI